MQKGTRGQKPLEGPMLYCGCSNTFVNTRKLSIACTIAKEDSSFLETQ